VRLDTEGKHIHSGLMPPVSRLLSDLIDNRVSSETEINGSLSVGLDAKGARRRSECEKKLQLVGKQSG